MRYRIIFFVFKSSSVSLFWYDKIISRWLLLWRSIYTGNFNLFYSGIYFEILNAMNHVVLLTKSWQKLRPESREVDSREMATGCWLKDFDWYADDSSSCCCLAPPLQSWQKLRPESREVDSREMATVCWLKDCTWYADDSSSCCCLASPLANTHLSYGAVKLRAHQNGALMCGSVSTKGFP